METRNENNSEKRRRKLVMSRPVLVRSVKPGQLSTGIWQKETSTPSGLWKN
jgi:hypothetical protein